jgi:hypothetical protein
MDPGTRDAFATIWLWLTVAASAGFIAGLLTGRIERRRTSAVIDSVGAGSRALPSTAPTHNAQGTAEGLRSPS